jgi:hypothetical protein
MRTTSPSPVALTLVLLACGGSHHGTAQGSPRDAGQEGGAASDSGAADRDGAVVASDASVTDHDAAGTDQDAPAQTFQYSPLTGPLSNPERGFYRSAAVAMDPYFDDYQKLGVRLVFSYVRLDAYRNQDLPQALLDAVTSGLDKARTAGMKLVLRFAYNDGPYPNSEPDASKAQILEHIAQLKDTLRANEDVIALVQAGFIGAWGEWHTSTNQLLDNPQDRQDIIEALLAALPAWMNTQIRYPPYKEAMYGAALDDAHAFDGSAAARMGHHNDCFLASDTDQGTYPDAQIDHFKEYVAADTRYVPMGGETCAVHDRNACSVAVPEMEKLHFSFLNEEYLDQVIARWHTEGCYEEIRDRMGYRLRLVQASFAPAARPGGQFLLSVQLRNDGFAAPFNPRTVEVVLRSPSDTQSAPVSEWEVRRWEPGADIVLKARVLLPASLADGTYQLALRLPDPHASVAGRVEYAIAFANQDVFDMATGDNRLGMIVLSQAGPGVADVKREQLEIQPLQ